MVGRGERGGELRGPQSQPRVTEGGKRGIRGEAGRRRGVGAAYHGVGERAAEDHAEGDARARQHDLVRLGLEARLGRVARRVGGVAPADGGMAGVRAGQADGQADGQGAAGGEGRDGVEAVERSS